MYKCEICNKPVIRKTKKHYHLKCMKYYQLVDYMNIRGYLDDDLKQRLSNKGYL